MNKLALVTDSASLSIDYDMSLLFEACQASGITTEICVWEDFMINWSHYDAVLIRSPWNCIERLPEFLAWCEKIATVTRLFNPPSVARWALNKHYLADLEAHGIPVVPSTFVKPECSPILAFRQFFTEHPQVTEIVIKPTVGSYSRGVQRFIKSREADAAVHISKLFELGCDVILQPYFESIDRDGETNLIYFDNVYSHAICKNALLMPDGTVNVPTLDFRKARIPDKDELTVGLAALTAAALHLNLEQPLLYGRVDLIRNNKNQPVVLELDICEPSLNLSFSEGSAKRLVNALLKRL